MRYQPEPSTIAGMPPHLPDPPVPHASPDTLIAAAAHVERAYGHGYRLAPCQHGNDGSVIFHVIAPDGSRFRVQANEANAAQIREHDEPGRPRRGPFTRVGLRLAHARDEGRSTSCPECGQMFRPGIDPSDPEHDRCPDCADAAVLGQIAEPGEVVLLAGDPRHGAA